MKRSHHIRKVALAAAAVLAGASGAVLAADPPAAAPAPAEAPKALPDLPERVIEKREGDYLFRLTVRPGNLKPNRVADLTIEITEDGLLTTLKSVGCGWEGVTQEPIGVSTITEYRVKRGEFFTVSTSDAEEEPPATELIDAGTYAEGYDTQMTFDGGNYLDLPEPANSPLVDAGTY
jgi:hypothetical protein